MTRSQAVSRQHPSIHLMLFLVLIGLCSVPNTAVSEKKFPEWNEKVFLEVEKRHGPNAATRIRELYQLIQTHINKPQTEQLETVNNYMNALPWIADSDLWKKEDYWATPFETLTTFGGDCEDIAIAKYAALRLMGFDDDSLGFAYVITTNNEPHMVLVFQPAPNEPSFVLDNQHPDVMPAKQRKDLKAIYAFKNNGDLFVIKDEGQGNRSILAKKESRKFQKWSTAKKRARENTQSYIPFNDGKPLIPEWAQQTQ